MSIHFVSGKPGGGKSFYGTKLCFDELLYGTRPIVTNLALLPGELNDYYQRNYDNPKHLRRYLLPWWLNWLFWFLPEWLLFVLEPICVEQIEERIKQPRVDDICNRVHLITDEEMAVFFTKRPGCEIEHITREQWKAGKRPDYSVVKDSGVFFCLDEVHIPFNARAWAETGAEVIYYLSQHRKLGDDVICITQSVANVDKQFRSVAQDYTYLRNLGKEVAGWFRLPLRFVRKTYSQPPAGENDKPMDWGIFSLDVNGLARCYDTAKGIGIHGRAGADTKERKRGLHWGWFVAAVVALVYFGPRIVPNYLARFLSPGQAKHSSSAPSQTQPSPTVPVTNSPPVGFPDVTVPQNNSQSNNAPQLYCTGYLTFPGVEPQANMSDGSIVTPPELQAITKSFVVVNGHKFPVRIQRLEYVPEPVPEYAMPAPAVSEMQRPSVQVTVIGQHQRQSVSMGRGSISSKIATLGQ